MHVAIYKGRRRPDTYVFVTGAEALAALPDDLLRALGELEHVMDLVLTPERRLARVEARTVLRALLQRGCYLQLPPQDERLPLAKRH